MEEKDDISLADESLSMSYNSISESTATTVMDQKTPNKIQSVTKHPINDPITHPPIKSKQDISTLLKNYNVIDIPSEPEAITEKKDAEYLNDSIDSQSDKTIIAGSFMESSSDASTTTEMNINSISESSSNNSLYLKNMLADALTEKPIEKNDAESEKILEIASEKSSSNASSNFETINVTDFTQSSSDIVKIGSDQTSAHTSGDELETATSSDIEIISSPNGDSSSTQSRHSPAKLTTGVKSKQNQDMNVDLLLEKMAFKRIKGHNRDASEASTLSDDFPLQDVDLMRRINEMTEILECRENKLVELGRKYLEAQENNAELKRQLDKVLDEKTQNNDWSQVRNN